MTGVYTAENSTSRLYGGYSLMVKPRFVEPKLRVRFSLATPRENTLRKKRFSRCVCKVFVQFQPFVFGF